MDFFHSYVKMTRAERFFRQGEVDSMSCRGWWRASTRRQQSLTHWLVIFEMGHLVPIVSIVVIYHQFDDQSVVTNQTGHVVRIITIYDSYYNYLVPIY